MDTDVWHYRETPTQKSPTKTHLCVEMPLSTVDHGTVTVHIVLIIYKASLAIFYIFLIVSKSHKKDQNYM